MEALNLDLADPVPAGDLVLDVAGRSAAVRTRTQRTDR